MDDAVSSALAWAAPIASTVLTTYAVALINRGERKRDEARAETEAKRAAEAEWRDAIEKRLDDQDRRIHDVLKGQTTQMRSDLVHKAHRYVDDLGCASTEEKDAFYEEYVDYCAICRQNGIVNSFVDQLAQQVMDLPGRKAERE